MNTSDHSSVLAELKLRLRSTLKPTPSAYPPWPDDDTLARMVMQHGHAGLSKIAQLYAAREKTIRLAREDPFGHGWEWECWKRADKFLPIHAWDDPQDGVWTPKSEVRLIAALGGNRASKSEWAVKRCVQQLLRFPKTRMIFISQKLETSRQNQQAYVWRYLPRGIKELNFKKDRQHTFYVKFQQATGFSDDKFVLPNGSEGVFLVFTQNPSDYEGIQVGCPDTRGVVGWYADESLPLEWLQLLTTRSATHDACGLWTFTALDGMTPALKETMGEGEVLEHQFAEMLADRQNLPTIPKGHMPTVQNGSRSNIKIVYFHTIENPMGGYERIKADCVGKPTYFVERKLYGFVRSLKGRVFTHFGSWNKVPPSVIPKTGCDYMHVDPAGARNWFMLWARVDMEGRVWVYDEWPTVEEQGEWAVTTTRNPADGGKGWDGDAGPAQEPVGFGIAQYKRKMLEIEAPVVEVSGEPETAFETKPKVVKRPVIVRRTVDRRAGPSPLPEDSGESTCIWEKLNERQVDPKTGVEEAPALAFDLAGGPGLEDDGLELIKQALWIEREKPLDPIMNFPRLFVSTKCQNLIWALENFTGRDGQKGACKDPIDCLRDLFTSGLEYVNESTYGSRGGGSY